MNNFFLIPLLIILFATIDPLAAEGRNSLKGDWSGVLDTGLMKLTLVLHIDQNKKDVLYAKMDSLEQGMNGLEVDAITLEGKQLKFSMKKLMATFEGTLNPDRTEINGQFTQHGLTLPLTLKRGVMNPIQWSRTQEPKPPYPYFEEEVTFTNQSAGISLSGTLTLPRTQPPFPAVILIQGSGPLDRNEAVLGHKPFLVLADYLTRQGIAVLRTDKRGVGQSTGKFELATSEDFAEDVSVGITYLKTRPEINSEQIGLIGHSEGGIIAPMVSAKSKDVAFMVLMAAPAVNGEEILNEQAERLQRSEGVPEAFISKDYALRKQMFNIVKTERNFEIAEKKLNEIYAKYLAEVPENLKTEMMNKTAFEAESKTLNTAWFRYFLNYQPAALLKQIKIPVLVLYGELDLQVPPKQNVPVMSKALEEAGNQDYIILTMPHQNHLFQYAKTGSIKEYAENEETISPLTLKMISEWILEKVSGY